MLSPKEAQEYWKKEPIKFSQSFFGSKLWDKQQEIFWAVRDHNRVAVESGNTIGKSRVAAEIVWWYLLSHYPSKVITTAPTMTQIEDILWKEIANLYHHSKVPIGGDLLTTEIKLNEEWFALGLSTNEVNRFMGFHSPNLLVIIDEAIGVDPMIWEAIEGLHASKILAIGNPLVPEGNFFKCFSSPLWHKIKVSCEECVDWQEKNEIIPGLVTRAWIDERREEWGIRSPLYQSRVLGEFPQESEDTLIQIKWVDKAREVEPIDDEDSIRVVAADVATKHGENKTVITERAGDTIYSMRGIDKTSATLAALEIKSHNHSFKAHNIIIDSDGFGEGVADIISSQRIAVSEFHGGYSSKAVDSVRYKNLKTQFYCQLAKKLEKGLISLRKLPQREFEILKSQLCSIKRRNPDAQGRLQIETKEDMLARNLPSPDYADSLMMSEYGIYLGVVSDIEPYGFR